MEDTHSATENQDWDWEEVLVPNSENPNNLSCQEEFDGDSSSFPCGDVIRSNYFSIESDYHLQSPNPNPKLEMEMERAVDSATSKENSLSSEIDPQFGSGSWMDPSQFPRSRVGKRRRNSSSSSSESSDLSADGQPHNDCSHHNHDFKEGGDIHGNGSGIEIGSGQFDPHFHNQEEEIEPQHGDGVAHDSLSTDKENDLNEGVEMKLVAQEEEEKDNKSSPKRENENEDEDEKKSVAWWRVPLEVLKYCVLRVSPVWSLSVAAAALMGFVLYRRRWLSKMKRKTQGIQLNVTVDDKKVSQFMSRAARLNEAFSVVKRVPIIRPSLPAPGFAAWPVVSLR